MVDKHVQDTETRTARVFDATTGSACRAPVSRYAVRTPMVLVPPDSRTRPATARREQPKISRRHPEPLDLH